MGNVPGKIDTPNQEESGRKQHRSESLNLGTVKPANRNRRATSLVGNLLSASGRARADSYNGQNNAYKRKSTKEKEKLREKHARELVVKYNETVDGGYLAPYGCYQFDKLDYDAEVVKTLIIERKLAPFYTPLQEYDDNWTYEELIKIVDGLTLHASFEPEPEEFEGVPLGDLKDDEFDYLIDKSVTKREQRRERSKIYKARLYYKRLQWQDRANEKFLELKLMDREPAHPKNPALANNDLKYDLYTNGTECPICFLYFPNPMNISRCCLQPICTECFVQIKRTDPHFPHDEIDPMEKQKPDEEKDPNLLVSEPANCPYCATPSFGVTYEKPTTRCTGIGGIYPSEFKLPSSNDQDVKKGKQSHRRSSISPDDPSVVTSDTIRPDWEINLNKERLRLARKSANATAIHVSNQLIDFDHPSRNASISSSVGGSPSRRRRTIDDIDEEMIQRAIKLSLQDR